MGRYDQVVFAGGGNRCWWQAGFWHTMEKQYDMKPTRISAISAGASTACMLYALPGYDGAKKVLDYYERTLAGMKKNANWENLFNKARIFPHYEIYRSALLESFGESGQNLQSAPDIWIGVSHIPRWLGPKLSVALGLFGYNVEKHVFKTLHPKIGKSLGFTREFVRAQDCKTSGELVELLLQSASTPPFTPVAFRGSRPVLDGGLVDNVPIDGLMPSQSGEDPQTALVLVTRRYPLPNLFERTLPGLQLKYVQPSRKVPISSWDYTKPSQMVETYHLGVRDAIELIRQKLV